MLVLIYKFDSYFTVVNILFIDTITVYMDIYNITEIMLSCNYSLQNICICIVDTLIHSHICII